MHKASRNKKKAQNHPRRKKEKKNSNRLELKKNKIH